MEVFREPPDVYGYHGAYYDHVVQCILHDRRHLVDGLETTQPGTDHSHLRIVETGRPVQLPSIHNLPTRIKVPDWLSR
jgi:hypothetical protein